MPQPLGADVKTIETIYSKRLKERARTQANMQSEFFKILKTTRFKSLSESTTKSLNLGPLEKKNNKPPKNYGTTDNRESRK